MSLTDIIMGDLFRKLNSEYSTSTEGPVYDFRKLEYLEVKEPTKEEKEFLIAELKEHPRMQFSQLVKHIKREQSLFQDWSDEELLIQLARTSWNMR